jgi:hypothetical protein
MYSCLVWHLKDRCPLEAVEDVSYDRVFFSYLINVAFAEAGHSVHHNQL